MPGLNPKQRKFVVEYLVDRNATQAAIRAGYAERNADVVGPRLYSNPAIKREIESKMKKMDENTEASAANTLKELWWIGTSDIGEAFNSDGTLKELSKMPPHIRRAIASIEVVEIKGRPGFTTKVKFWDKPKALELTGKHFKMYTEKFEVTDTANGLADRLRKARERLKKKRAA